MVAKTYIQSDQLCNTDHIMMLLVLEGCMSGTVKSSFGQNVNYYPSYTFPPPSEPHPMNNFSIYSVFKMNHELVQHDFIRIYQKKVSQHVSCYKVQTF
jgi:hypothetical protein